MRLKIPQRSGGAGEGGMDTMTVANMGATAVPRLRGLRVWRGFGRPLAAARPPGAGREGAGANRRNPANPQSTRPRRETMPERPTSHQPDPPAFSPNPR